MSELDVKTTPAVVGAGALAAQTREQTEIQSAIITAKRFPRNEAEAFAKVQKAFSRPGMAQMTTYDYPRGKTTISGPSVKCAREIARCWKNIWYGFRYVETSNELIRVRGIAHDLESNAHAEVEDEFKPLVQRVRGGKTQWVVPDERDLRELVNRHGSVCERNALLKILPSDLVEEALRAATQAQLPSNTGEPILDPNESLEKVLIAYDNLGVSLSQIVARLGHSFNEITEGELADLREIYKLIKAEQGQVSEFFPEV